MTDPDFAGNIAHSRELIRVANAERETLQRTIAQSEAIIERSRAIMAQLDTLLAALDGK